MLLRSAIPLAHKGRAVGDWLIRWAAQTPDRVFLAEREHDRWRTLTYRDALARVRAVGESLLSRGLTAASPVLILSGNSIDHALLSLGAMHAGVPVVPVSPAYSLAARNFATLKAVAASLRPGLVFAEQPDDFAPALAALDAPATTLADLADRPGPRIDDAFASIGPDTIAKILLTSGSTGAPKPVINTHRMLCSSQESWAALWPFLEDVSPVVCDWLPWSHTVGGNAIFNLVLRNGGTFYIDGGRPTASGIATTIHNLRCVSPTIYFNVPAGFERLVSHLEEDDELRTTFLSRLDAIYSTGAALQRPLWDRLKQVTAQSGRRVWMLAGWGSTEMTLATRVHQDTDDPANVGTPGPGVQVRLVPCGDRFEARVRGPQVTPGYFNRADLTAAAFDEHGFYRSGDAMRLAEPRDPSRGLIFDGRIGEDFKLSSGTWVRVGAVRARLIAACHPLVQDVVVTGHDRDDVGALIALSADAIRSLGLSDDDVRARLRSALEMLRADNGGMSMSPSRIIVLNDPPSLDAGEITDKGYLNQQRLLEGRAEIVAALYRGDPPAIVL